MNRKPSRRLLLRGTAALMAGSALPGWAGSNPASGAADSAPAVIGTKKIPRLLLAGPFASVSNPLIRIVEAGLLRDVAEQVDFVSWRTPDQLRAMALKGEADFLAMPSNLPANLYNRGVRLQLINVGIWGILWMMARRDGLKTLADFKGEEVVMPFRGDMPDVVFQLLCRKQGIDPARDMTLRYVASPLDAMQLLITRRADNALLADPAIAVGLRKSRSFPVSAIAPTLYRSVSLQDEWGRLFGRAPRIPQAGIVMLGKQLGNVALARRFEQACEEALQWCEAHPDECGEIVARRIEMLTPEGIADAIRADNADMVVASKARPELEFFYRQLMSMQPGLVGGKLPDDGFYFGA
ncbi:MAG: ABC transporter substrate-binding protein [Lautropia sp.]|nr:ABC transporter substrate-binding protein [Lautropia sp.]